MDKKGDWKAPAFSIEKEFIHNDNLADIAGQYAQALAMEEADKVELFQLVGLLQKSTGAKILNIEDCQQIGADRALLVNLPKDILLKNDDFQINVLYRSYPNGQICFTRCMKQTEDALVVNTIRNVQTSTSKINEIANIQFALKRATDQMRKRQVDKQDHPLFHLLVKCAFKYKSAQNAPIKFPFQIKIIGSEVIEENIQWASVQPIVDGIIVSGVVTNAIKVKTTLFDNRTNKTNRKKIEAHVELNQEVLDWEPEQLAAIYWTHMNNQILYEDQGNHLKAINSFLEYFDPELLTYCKPRSSSGGGLLLDADGRVFQRNEKVADINPCVYNWIKEGEKDGVNYRTQAMKRWSTLINSCIRSYNRKNATATRFGNLIDRGESPVATFQEFLGLPENIIKHLPTNLMEYAEHTLNLEENKSVFQELSDKLPANCWPNKNNSIDQWRNFFLTVQILGNQDGTINGIFPSISSAMGKAASFWQINSSTHISQLYHLEDCAESFTAQVLFPILFKKFPQTMELGHLRLLDIVSKPLMEESSLLVQSLGSKYSLLQISRIAEYWANHQWQIDAQIMGDQAVGEWPALLNAQELAKSLCKDIQVVPVILNTAKLLGEEGRKQQHCVGSYVRRCIHEPHHILSLRKPDGEILSTLELEIIDDSHEVQICQNRGYLNSDPCEQVIAATKILLNEINGKKLAVDWKGLSSSLRERGYSRQSTSAYVAEMIGYNWEEEGIVERAWKAWHFALPRSYRALEYQDWVQTLPLQRLEFVISEIMDSNHHKP